MKACKHHGCDKPHYAKGFCNKHWQRNRANGSPHEADLKRRPDGAVSIRDANGNKQCLSCEEWLPEDRFGNHGATHDGKQVKCRGCVRLANYHLAPAVARAMLQAQDHLCAICGCDIAGRFCIDHDHSCCPGPRSCGNCVRGLLCDACNHGLGSFRDDPKSLFRAIQYLRRSN